MIVRELKGWRGVLVRGVASLVIIIVCFAGMVLLADTQSEAGNSLGCALREERDATPLFYTEVDSCAGWSRRGDLPELSAETAGE